MYWIPGGGKVVQSGCERCKFFWQGCAQEIGGVGVMISEKWANQVVEIKRVNERSLLVKLLYGK